MFVGAVLRDCPWSRRRYLPRSARLRRATPHYFSGVHPERSYRGFKQPLRIPATLVDGIKLSVRPGFPHRTPITMQIINSGSDDFLEATSLPAPVFFRGRPIQQGHNTLCPVTRHCTQYPSLFALLALVAFPGAFLINKRCTETNKHLWIWQLAPIKQIFQFYP